jgi:hypothetical protein
MVRTCLAAVVVVLLGGVFLRAEDLKAAPKDQPRQLEGTVKKVDQAGPEAPALTITVKELKPTDKEDMMQEVNTDYRFRVTASTLIFGLDGKPDRRGLNGLEPGARVRVEYKKDLALEVKGLQPR